MISAADFSDIFPSMAEHRAPRRQAEAQYDSCIARWEDDGGGMHSRPSSVPPAAHESDAAEIGSRSLEVDAALLLIPALIVLWSSWPFSGRALK
jgi:hypothetical protein